MRLAAAFGVALLLAAPAAARRKPAEPAPVPPSAGGLVDDVNGYTIGKDGGLHRFTGLLIGKDGRVTKLLGPADARPERLDFRLDGQKRTLLPGLIDAHGHVLSLGFSLLRLDLSGTTSLAAAQAALRDYAVRTPTPVWIRGGGWNQETWGVV